MHQKTPFNFEIEAEKDKWFFTVELHLLPNKYW